MPNNLSDLDRRRRENSRMLGEQVDELVRAWPGPETAVAFRAAVRHLGNDPLEHRPGNRWGEAQACVRQLIVEWPEDARGDVYHRALERLRASCRSCGAGAVTNSLCRECWGAFAAEPARPLDAA